MKSSVVIGANYGDEGKGLMTDFLCKKYDADLVVRFNGGAQAGHTVVTPEGQRHIFGHIGSGYFLGVPTYLSDYFILNPILYRKEVKQLSAFKRRFDLYVSPKSEITTYWDMLANRAMEEMREGNLHGSCGAGINATLERAKICPFNFSEIREVRDERSIAQYHEWMHKLGLESIQFFWKRELEKFSEEIKKPIPAWAIERFYHGEEINEQFIDDIEFMYKTVIFVGDPSIIFLNRHHVIFEGAQGLALDQFFGNFPYVTHSNTGMRNIIEMQRLCQGNFSIDEIVYVSRTYETRHGNDPNFVGGLTLEGASDKTNVKNEWQGELRYKELSYSRLWDRIKLDLQANNLLDFRTEHGVCLAFTHTDQIPINDLEHNEFIRQTNQSVPLKYVSKGETRNDVIDRTPNI